MVPDASRKQQTNFLAFELPWWWCQKVCPYVRAQLIKAYNRKHAWHTKCLTNIHTTVQFYHSNAKIPARQLDECLYLVEKHMRTQADPSTASAIAWSVEPPISSTSIHTCQDEWNYFDGIGRNIGTISPSVLLKMFINVNESCHTTDAP